MLQKFTQIQVTLMSWVLFVALLSALHFCILSCVLYSVIIIDRIATKNHSKIYSKIYYYRTRFCFDLKCKLDDIPTNLRHLCPTSKWNTGDRGAD